MPEALEVFLMPDGTMPRPIGKGGDYADRTPVQTMSGIRDQLPTLRKEHDSEMWNLDDE